MRLQKIHIHYRTVQGSAGPGAGHLLFDSFDITNEITAENKLFPVDY